VPTDAGLHRLEDRLGDLRLRCFELPELRAEHREDLRRSGRGDGRAAAAIPKDRDLAEEVARTQLGKGHVTGRDDDTPVWSEGRIHVRTAGSSPADQINPAVIAVIAAMSEIGVDMSEEFPKPLPMKSYVRPTS
jgi:hypothetical protein